MRRFAFIALAVVISANSAQACGKCGGKAKGKFKFKGGTPCASAMGQVQSFATTGGCGPVASVASYGYSYSVAQYSHTAPQTVAPPVVWPSAQTATPTPIPASPVPVAPPKTLPYPRVPADDAVPPIPVPNQPIQTGPSFPGF